MSRSCLPREIRAKPDAMFRTDFFLIVLKKYEETNRSRTSLLSYKRDSAIKKEMNTPAQHFAHGLKIFAMLAITQTGFWFTPIASGNGLGNTTKGFTPTREMHPADWSNPEELDRTWKWRFSGFQMEMRSSRARLPTFPLLNYPPDKNASQRSSICMGVVEFGQGPTQGWMCSRRVGLR